MTKCFAVENKSPLKLFPLVHILVTLEIVKSSSDSPKLITPSVNDIAADVVVATACAPVSDKTFPNHSPADKLRSDNNSFAIETVSSP